MKVYRVLTDELLSDELIAGQPSFSADYMRKVVLSVLGCLIYNGHDQGHIIDTCGWVHHCQNMRGRCLQMLDYNVPGGKLNRGLAVGDILGHLQQDQVRSSSCGHVHDHAASFYQMLLLILGPSACTHLMSGISYVGDRAANVRGQCLGMVH